MKDNIFLGGIVRHFMCELGIFECVCFVSSNQQEKAMRPKSQYNALQSLIEVC